MLSSSLKCNMRFSVQWSWLAALSCLLCMGGGVWCDCTETNMRIVGGDYKLTKQLQTGSKLIYNCPEGYYPYPALSRLCQPNGTWIPEPKIFAPQRCRIVECPDPNVLENGNVFPPQERYFVKNETSYECFSGYKMRGSSRRICLPQGKWSGSTPICSRDTGHYCADPGVPAGASRIGNTFGTGDTVEYICNNNLFLVGSSERVCQENGQWTGKEPACYYKHTYDTPLEVSQAFGSVIKDRLKSVEPIDDTQEGRKIRISRNGTLNIYTAIDISASIPPEDITNATEVVKKLISKISSFSVSPNYEILFFSCDIFEVINILDFWDDKVTLNKIISDMDNFQIGVRNTVQTDLNVVFKTFLERMIMIKHRVGEEAFKEQRHVFLVFTDGGYNMGEPAANVAKIKKMVNTIESRDEYLDIYILAIGVDIFDDDLQTLTAGTGGRHYFRMKDLINLPETFDDMIDEEEVTGLCGLHKDYETYDQNSKRKMYPWFASVHVRNSLKASKRCLGSLVSPQFVLTAAHCFSFGDLPEHVTVDIGRRVQKVKNFFIHPNYNVNAKVNQGVKEFYDYDVALIQLEEEVQISIVVRPICIPCTQETNDALKLVDTSTCNDQEQLLLKNHLERLSFLTQTRNMVYEKDVHAKLGDNRDECIRHALNTPGITTNNPKDAVTDNFLCTGGLNPVRDHVACTGDGGGAVFKNYEHRTIQVAVVSWGNKDLCTGRDRTESDDTSRDFHLNLFRVVPFLKSILGNDNQDDYAPLRFLKS